jgi:type IX secretion system PorP/SprF family membrane protein
MKKGLLIAYCLLQTAYCFSQQDAQYSQYMFNQLALNPAYAGSHEVLATSLTYRNQWTGIEGAPTTAQFSIQMPLKKKNVGLGAEILSDKIGPKSANAILVSYAYRLPLLKGKLSFGLRMGMYNYVYDWSKMDYKDLNDAYYANNASDRTSKLTGTGDFGMYYNSRTFYCGLGLTHLNRGKTSKLSVGDSTSRQAFHYFLPVSKAFEVGSVVINPTILIKGATHSPTEVDVNCNVLLKERLWVGASLRSNYGVVLLTQFQINEKMKAGYSYDFGSNKIGKTGKGSHEIMIGYDINILGSKILTPRYL